MITGNFLNEKQHKELEQITRRSIEPHGVAHRANAILLLDDGKSCSLIAAFLYLDDDTIHTWYIRRAYGQYYARPGAIKLMHRLGFEYKRPTAHFVPQYGHNKWTGQSAELCKLAQPRKRNGVHL